MFFNYLFYFGFFASVVLWRWGGARSRPFVLLAFNLFCLGLFFSSSLVLLGVAALAYFAVAGSRLKGAFAVSLVALGATFFFAKLGAFPAGLSFVLFLAIGYLIDAHRGVAVVRPAPAEYAAAITFAPFLSAGPFVSLRSLLERVRDPQDPSEASDREAALLFAYGLAKKTFADWIFFAYGVSTISAGRPLTLSALCAVPAFLFADFSGYSDMARGLALAFGFRVPPNFLSPYLAPDFGAFWRRWHVSLGDWFHGYVYQTLVFELGPRWGLSRRAFLLWAQLSVMISAVAVGLWHGIGAKFLVWGLLVGLLILVPSLTAAGRPESLLSLVSARIRLVVLVVFVQLVFVAPDLSYVASVIANPLPLLVPWQLLPAASALFLAAALNYLDALAYSRTASLLRGPWFFILVGVGFVVGFGGHQFGETFVYSRF